MKIVKIGQQRERERERVRVRERDYRFINIRKHSEFTAVESKHLEANCVNMLYIIDLLLLVLSAATEAFGS